MNTQPEKLIEYGRLEVFTVQSKSAATTTGESAHPFPSYVLLSKKKQQSIKKVEAQTTAAPSFYDHRFSLASLNDKEAVPWNGVRGDIRLKIDQVYTEVHY